MGRKAIITGIAHWVPEDVLTNHDLEQMVDTSDEWIRTRTGIRERRILKDKDKATAYMGAQATKKLLEERGMSPEDIEVIVVCTVTPDMMFPNTASLVQEMIGAKNAWGFDLNAACSGFLYGLGTASQLIESGRHKTVLLIGADKMSAITDYQDRNNCILFGDGAGAVLLEASEEEGYGLIDYIFRNDGSGKDYLCMKAGGSLHPASHETVEKRWHYLYQDGRSVFKFAVVGMADISEQILKKNDLEGKDIKLFIAHQANYRIIDASARRLKLDDSQVVINIDRYGNTTAATIPIALSEVYHEGRLQKGDLILMAAFGAGFTWGSLLYRWAI